jgi:hypothetical protein
MWTRKQKEQKPQQPAKLSYFGKDTLASAGQSYTDEQLCDVKTNNVTFFNYEVEFLNYERARYANSEFANVGSMTGTLNYTCVEVSNILATFTESFDVQVSVSVCGEYVDSVIPVYRKQFLYDVFVRLWETNYGACTGLNIPVWIMSDYAAEPDINNVVVTATNFTPTVDNTKLSLISDSTHAICVKIPEKAVKLTYTPSP